MNDNIKEIVSRFLKTAPENITDVTVIDRGAVGSSVIFHRMFAKLADAGVVIQDYHNIKTFGDLFQKQQVRESEDTVSPLTVSSLSVAGLNARELALAVGIDMESINAMPVVADFREDNFYKQNFSAREISYCILQLNPYASFAGLFAAKEAIVKSDNQFVYLPFNQIEIQHDLRGKPFFKDYAISISHTEEMAVSIALNNNLNPHAAVNNNVTPETNTPSNPANQNLVMGLAALALIVSLAALGLMVFRTVA